MRLLVGLSLNFRTKSDKQADKNDKINTLNRVIYMAINYGKIRYLKTCASVKDLPDDRLPEIVLAGRSNVGKSSLVNALGSNRKLAKVSQTPGKTRAVVFFEFDGKLMIADLPGYGYAKISHEKKAQFSSLADSYFTSGRRFDLVLHLMDIRREPTEEDVAMFEYMNANDIRYFVVFTKCDKFSNAQLRRRIEELKDIYNFDENADIFAVSSSKKQGINELREAIAKLLI